MLKYCKHCNDSFEETSDHWIKNKDSSCVLGYYLVCREHRAKLAMKYFNANKKLYLERQKELRKEHKERYAGYTKKCYEKYKESRREYSKEWAKKNRKDISEKECTRYQTDLNFRWRKLLRASIKRAILKGNLSSSYLDLLGCSIEQLKLHLESKFKEGMTWENYGTSGWTVDHIVPLCSFDLTDELQRKQASHYTNLQPMWLYDNILKGKK